MRNIAVELGERSYPIKIENGLLSRAGAEIAGLGFSGKAAVVTNPLVNSLYGKKVIDALEGAGLEAHLIIVPDGEEYKTLETVSSVFDALVENRFERNSPIIALGGGVIGDMAGFAAATFLRGVPYIQIPTTLLSQVDSSVGGKTGVNHPKGKNLIGAFYQPKAVFIDPLTLTTLDIREVRAGLAEVVKYGVIKDKEFFSFLERTASRLFEPGDELIKAIERSCVLKAEVVGIDEKEGGLRAILNFGHTFGHAIEALTGYGTYKHGEAVSIGMVMAARLSNFLGLTGTDTVKRIESLCKTLGLPVVRPYIKTEDFMASMQLDKKVSGGKLRFVLVKEIGEVSIQTVYAEKIEDFLRS